MSFYKDKLKNYSNIKVSPELLDATRKSIIFSMKKKYDQLIEDLKYDALSRRGFYDGLDGLIPLEEIKRLEHELSFVSVLNNEDFYTYYKNMEALGLSKFEREKNEKKKEYYDTLTKYKLKKGVVGKMSAFFGTNQEKVEKYQKLYNEISSYILNVEDAVKEFGSLTTEEVQKYIIGRYAVDNKFEFDPVEFGKYIESVKLQKEQEAEPSNS